MGNRCGASTSSSCHQTPEVPRNKTVKKDLTEGSQLIATAYHGEELDPKNVASPATGKVCSNNKWVVPNFEKT
jgi:hypothetical protein